MSKFITVLGILTLLFLAGCERQEQQPATRTGEPARTEQPATPPSQAPGQTQDQAPGQTPSQTPGQTPDQAPGQTPGQAPAGEQR